MKKAIGKLKLSRETVATLDAAALSRVGGGASELKGCHVESNACRTNWVSCDPVCTLPFKPLG